jgi:MerR family Zn(II)-responsive transcriptional regulator of zntA
MARLSNSTLRTVRFYEEEGILRPAKRTEGGHRLFRRTELDRLLFVTDLRTAGLSLDEIKEILELKKSAASGEAAAKEARRIFTSRIQELEGKVAVLTRLRDEFSRTSDIVSACLSCRDNEHFPDACGDCSVMTSHASLPRSARVVWSVGSTPSKPLVSPADEDAVAHPANGAGANGAGANGAGANGAGAIKVELGPSEG